MGKEEKSYQKLDMLGKVYESRQVDFETENKKDRKILSKITHEVKLEEIEEKINEALSQRDKMEKAEDIINNIELLVENYEIQIAYYSQKSYKRGFKDAMCLYMQCLEED